MRLSLNPEVYRDFDKAIVYYEVNASLRVAGRFTNEFRRLCREVAARPSSFSKVDGDRRSAQMKRFPYHLVFRIEDESVRILVLKHDSVTRLMACGADDVASAILRSSAEVARPM